ESKESVGLKRKILATPVARKMAKDLSIDITLVTGSGPVGRVMKEDIKTYSEANVSSSKSLKEKASNKASSHKTDKVYHDFDKELDGYDYERIPMTMLRKTVAKNMTISKFTIPHTSAMDEFDVTELVNFREIQKEKLKDKGIKLTYLPIIIKAIAIALKKYPVMNSSLDESSDEIIRKNFYNIGIAVDTKDGLMVPVIKDADKSGIIDIADRLELLTENCRNKTVKLDDLSNGTFTITNYGAIGSTYGVPVIKFPEAAIIGIGKIKKSPEVIDGEIVIRDIMPVSLSFDHRIIDGADAGRFLNEVKELLRDPVLLLMR
ncbi:MAG: dihydrolipoamide acetyltransferase family protein, partial [Acidaminobacteraceae bacterium]